MEKLIESIYKKAGVELKESTPDVDYDLHVYDIKWMSDKDLEIDGLDPLLWDEMPEEVDFYISKDDINEYHENDSKYSDDDIASEMAIETFDRPMKNWKIEKIFNESLNETYEDEDMFEDPQGILGVPGDEYTFSEIEMIYDWGKRDGDPSMQGYISFEDWWKDTRGYLNRIIPIDESLNEACEDEKSLKEALEETYYVIYDPEEGFYKEIREDKVYDGEYITDCTKQLNKAIKYSSFEEAEEDLEKSILPQFRGEHPYDIEILQITPTKL